VYIRQQSRESAVWKLQDQNFSPDWNYQAIDLGRIAGEFEILFLATRYNNFFTSKIRFYSSFDVISWISLILLIVVLNFA